MADDSTGAVTDKDGNGRGDTIFFFLKLDWIAPK